MEETIIFVMDIHQSREDNNRHMLWYEEVSTGLEQGLLLPCDNRTKQILSNHQEFIGRDMLMRFQGRDEEEYLLQPVLGEVIN